MALTDLTLKSRYNPDNCDDIVAEFYRPALAQAVSYDRTTYTFSPNALAAVGRGLESFLLAEGHIRLICNCELSMPVYQAIKDGLAQAPDVLLEVVPPRTLIESSDLLDKEQKRALDLLTWLVAQGRIEIKVAFVQEGHRIFHEKEGILTDADGNRLRSQAPPTKHAPAGLKTMNSLWYSQIGKNLVVLTMRNTTSTFYGRTSQSRYHHANIRNAHQCAQANSAAPIPGAPAKRRRS